MELEYYKSLSEVKEAFDVEYINNSYEFNCLIGRLQKEENSLYRGVSSPRYKMYSSAQRFYLDNKESLFDDMSYSNFLKKLYEFSKQLGGGELLSLYDKVQKDNYVLKEEQKSTIPYNPIWVFHTLQHLSECSPFLDFSKDFFIALYFAAQKISPVWCDNISKSEIDNYIEIISFDEKKVFPADKASIIDKMLNENDPDKVVENIIKFDLSDYQNGELEYVCYEGSIIVVKNDFLNVHYSFTNENCMAQSGRLFLTSNNEDKTFEQMWDDIFHNSQKLKAYLIHKSLATDIYQSLTAHLLGKMLVPIQKDYNDEIKELIIKNNK